MSSQPLTRAIFILLSIICTVCILSEYIAAIIGFDGISDFSVITLEEEDYDRDVILGSIKFLEKILPYRDNNFTAHELCNRTDMCVPADKHQETRLRVAPKQRMISCLVKKSMSTVMANIMCYLYNETKYEKKVQRRNMTVWDKLQLCKGKNENVLFSSAERRVKNTTRKDWSYSMITRDPVDRFLSGYVDRCVRLPQKMTPKVDGKGYYDEEEETPCNGCGYNLTCFVLTEYQVFMDHARDKDKNSTFEQRHFFPQNWKCNSVSLRNKYTFIRYSSDPTKELMDDLFTLLRERKVKGRQLEFIRNELTEQRNTSHTTILSPTRDFYNQRLRSSPFLMEYVVKMFYHDFIIFNYTFPQGFI